MTFKVGDRVWHKDFSWDEGTPATVVRVMKECVDLICLRPEGSTYHWRITPTRAKHELSQRVDFCPELDGEAKR